MSSINAPQEISTLDVVRHFWSRLWIFLIVPPIILVGSYLYIRNFMGETFESSATLMVRLQPSELRSQRQAMIMEWDPPVYEDILQSDEILRQVIDAARQRYPGEYGQWGFEKQKRLFEVRSLMTRDTSVQTRFSPVLILTAKAGSPEVAHFLVETWTELVIERYGTLRSRHAEGMQRTMSNRYDELSQVAMELQEAEARLSQNIANATMLMEAKHRLLSGALLRPGREEGAAPGGLLQERARLRLDLAEGSGGNEASGLKARLERVEQMIAETREEIEDLTLRKIAHSGELEDVRNRLGSVRSRMAEIRTVMAMISVDTTPLVDPFNPEIQGDFLVLSRAVQPEVRVAPARTVIAIGITAFLTGLMALLVILELYVRRAVMGR